MSCLTITLLLIYTLCMYILQTSSMIDAPPSPGLDDTSFELRLDGADDQITTSTPTREPNQSFTAHHASLPNFSELIRVQLESGDIVHHMDRLVDETAYHVMGLASFKDRGEYQDFGRAIHTLYPCIGHPGREPWVSRIIRPSCAIQC